MPTAPPDGPSLLPALAPVSLTVVPVPGNGPEDVLVGDDGTVYAGTDDGAIHAVPSDGRVRVVGRTGGRPLGLEWLADGRVLVCDADRGLLALDPANGEIEVLLDAVEGEPMRFCNNAAVHSDGTIWFSDSSRHHGIHNWRADMVEDTRSGRLLRRDPDGSVEVVLDGLRFANGVALAEDESFVCVAETAGRRVVRRWLTGERAGTLDTLADDLPGYPDNVSRGSDGLIWVTIASPTSGVVALLHRSPLPVRRLAWRLPQALQPQPKRTVRVVAFDDDGRVVHDITGDAGSFHMATGVREHDGTVWLGSLQGSAIASFAV